MHSQGFPFQLPDNIVNNLHGSARWLTTTDAEAAGLFDDRGVVLGQTQSGRLMRFNRDGHIMVFAPTGAGKGIGFVQANLVDYRGSIVVLDPKGENAIVSAAHRRSLGQDVIILDPFGKTGLPGNRYNPLGALSFATDENLGPMIEALADALIPMGEHKENPHWPLGAKRFVSFLMWFMVAHEPPERRHLVRLYELAYSGYPILSKVARIMAEGRHPNPNVKRVCMAMGNWFLGREEKEFTYFESQVQNNLGWIGDFVWSPVLASPPSPPMPLKLKAMTVYLVLPFNRIERYRPWLRVMVADLINCLYDTPGTLHDPVLFMLDEAYAGLGHMESLFSAAAAVRSAGARLCFIYQDIQQVQKLYGKAWGSLIANSGATLFWSMGADLEAAQLISQLAGSRTVSMPGNPGGVGQPLIRPEEVLQLPSDEIIGIFRSLPPARFERLNVLTDTRFSSKLAKNTTYGAPRAASASAPVARDWVPVSLDSPRSFSAAAGKQAPQHDDDIQALSRQTGIAASQLEALRAQFGTLHLQGDALGYLNERGMFEFLMNVGH